MIDSKVVLRELLQVPAKRARKNCQSSNGSSSSLLTEDRCFGKRSSEPMTFATFQAFEVFRTFWWFFDFLTTFWPTFWPTFHHHHHHHLLNHNLGRTNWQIHWCSECSLLWPPSSPPSPPPSPPTPTPPFPGLVVDSVLPEGFNIEVNGAAIRLSSLDESPVKSDKYLNVSADWTWHILESKLLVKIDTSTRRVEPWSKAMSTGSWWSTSNTQSKATVLRMNNIRAPTDDLEGYLHRIIVDAGALG